MTTLLGLQSQGRTTLLLGAPGCGKSTLMRVLADRLRGCGALNVQGQVRGMGREGVGVSEPPLDVSSCVNMLSACSMPADVTMRHARPHPRCCTTATARTRSPSSGQCRLWSRCALPTLNALRTRVQPLATSWQQQARTLCRAPWCVLPTQVSIASHSCARAPLPAHHLQRDNHMGNLTVAETLSFAHTCQAGSAPPSFDMQQQIRDAKVRTCSQCL